MKKEKLFTKNQLLIAMFFFLAFACYPLATLSASVGVKLQNSRILSPESGKSPFSMTCTSRSRANYDSSEQGYDDCLRLSDSSNELSKETSLPADERPARTPQFSIETDKSVSF